MDADTLLSTILALSVKMKRKLPWDRRKCKQKIVKLLNIYYSLRECEKRRCKFWVRPIFSIDKRMEHGHSDNLLVEMRLNDPEKYFNFLRMTPAMFDELLRIVGPRIAKPHVIRDTISSKTRLEVTLRYLADGLSMTSCSYDFRIGKNTASVIIAETCQALWDCLRESVFPSHTADNFKEVARGFEIMWNFKNCIGAIDGKHVIVQAPPHAGSDYYNYKNSHSINLLAVSDAKSRFIMVDIGAQGRLSDGGIFRGSSIGQMFEQGQFPVPPPEYIPELNAELPYVLIGDEAFALSTYMMRPYPRSGTLNRRKRIFNYRLSRARRMIESAFGILAARWRIFRKPIIACIPTLLKIVQATVCLHNFIMQQEALEPHGHRRYGTLTREDRQLEAGALIDITRTGSNTYTRNAALIRDAFAQYFETVDILEFQNVRILHSDF